MQKNILWIAGIIFLLATMAFGKKTGQQPHTLFDTRWNLKKITSPKGTADIVSGAFIRFNLEKQSAGGHGSCNSFGSTARITGNKLSLTNLFSTKMYCEGVQQTEDLFFKSLEKANRFVISGQTLFLYQDETLLLEFTAG